MASEQCVIVGVISTKTVCRSRVRGLIWMSGRFTTAREPRERGCSGSEMVDMRSIYTTWFSRKLSCKDMYGLKDRRNTSAVSTNRKFLARLSARLHYRHRYLIPRMQALQMDR